MIRYYQVEMAGQLLLKTKREISLEMYLINPKKTDRI